MRLLDSIRAWLPRRKHVRPGAVGVFVGILALSIALMLVPSSRVFLTSPTALRDVATRFGTIAPLAIIAYYIVQIIIVPAPGQPLDVTVGYLYGLQAGSLIAAIGVFLGTTLAIALARRFGHPFIRNFVETRRLRRLEAALSHRSRWFFLALFLIPGTPADLLCLLFGLTRVPFWQAVTIANLGRLPTTIGGILLGATGRSWSPLPLGILSLAVFLVIFTLSQLLPRRWRVFRSLSI